MNDLQDDDVHARSVFPPAANTFCIQEWLVSRHGAEMRTLKSSHWLACRGVRQHPCTLLYTAAHVSIMNPPRDGGSQTLVRVAMD
jgi:hypothetical protein